MLKEGNKRRIDEMKVEVEIDHSFKTTLRRVRGKWSCRKNARHKTGNESRYLKYGGEKGSKKTENENGRTPGKNGRRTENNSKI